jgi:hypothetical protein
LQLGKPMFSWTSQKRYRLEGDTDVIVERFAIYDDNVNGSIEESNIATIVYYWV